MKKGRAFFDWLFFLHMHTQGANWMVGRKPGETERGIESLDLEARSLSHNFPFKYQGNKTSIFCVQLQHNIEYKIYFVIRALDAAWCPEALNKAGYPWKVFTARGAWVGDTMLR